MSSVMENHFKLHKRIRQFEIDGIQMLGNLCNGSIVGLDEKGRGFVEQIINDRPIHTDLLDNEEKQLLEYMIENNFFNEEETTLKAAYLHLTDKCNLHCIGCYSYVEERNINQGLAFESICLILDELKSSGVEQVVFSGGEPFIRNDISEICKYTKQVVGISNLHVITNGTMNYSKYIEAFQYIDTLSVSIDGFDENTQFIRDKGIMPKIIKNITYLKEKVPVTLIATIHAKNVNHIDEYIHFANELGVQLSFSIFTVDPDEEHFKTFIFDNKSLMEFSKKISNLDQNIPIYDMPSGEVELTCRGNCEVGKEMISIGADGTIYPCHMLHDSSLKLGNVLETSLEKALSDSANPFLQLDVDEIHECKDCNYKYLCGGGCRGRSWLYHKSLLHRDSFCPFIKNFYQDSILKLKQSISLIES